MSADESPCCGAAESVVNRGDDGVYRRCSACGREVELHVEVTVESSARVLGVERRGGNLRVEAKATGGDWHGWLEGPADRFPVGIRRGEVVAIAHSLNHRQLGKKPYARIARLDDGVGR